MLKCEISGFNTYSNMCCLEYNFIILKYTNRTSDVYAYDKSYEPFENVPKVNGTSVYDDIITGVTYIILFNEIFYYGTKLSLSLIHYNQ